MSNKSLKKKKREAAEHQLCLKIQYFLRRDKRTFFLKNPYQEDDVFDLVEYIGQFFVSELYPFTTIFVKTKDEKRKKFGVQAEYFWYDDRWTYSSMAALILYHILKNNGNNIRIKTKLREYYNKAIEELKVNEVETSKLLEDILKKKTEIARLSS